MEAILGVIVGFIAFGVIWFFLLKPKDNQVSTDELRLKEEELKKSQIDLATREAVTAANTLRPGVTESRSLSNALLEEVKVAKGPVQTPKTIHFVDSIPLTPVGKPDKRRLSEVYATQSDSEAALKD